MALIGTTTTTTTTIILLPLQWMMWFLLFQHHLSPHHAISPSGNLHTQCQPPPESAAHGVGKLHRWSKPAESTTLTLTLALALTHSLSSSAYIYMRSAYNFNCLWSGQAAMSRSPSILWCCLPRCNQMLPLHTLFITNHPEHHVPLRWALQLLLPLPISPHHLSLIPQIYLHLILGISQMD